MDKSVEVANDPQMSQKNYERKHRQSLVQKNIYARLLALIFFGVIGVVSGLSAVGAGTRLMALGPVVVTSGVVLSHRNVERETVSEESPKTRQMVSATLVEVSYEDEGQPREFRFDHPPEIAAKKFPVDARVKVYLVGGEPTVVPQLKGDHGSNIVVFGVISLLLGILCMVGVFLTWRQIRRRLGSRHQD